MQRQSNEDLFANSTMTFGEHLEELRITLTRSLIGLTIGFLIGLAAAKHVVKIIEIPLIEALQKYLSASATDELKSIYPDGVPKGVSQFVADQRMIYEEIYVERSELARWASDASPNPELESDHPLEPETEKQLEEEAIADAARLNALAQSKLPRPDRRMIKTRIWRPARARLTTLSPHETFVIWIKAAFVSGIIIASPYIFYEIWIFVAAGLYPHERRWVYVFLPFSLMLFATGAAMAFFFVFGPVLDFLFGFARMMNIAPDLRISEVISFVLFLPLGFGLAFQLPLVMLFLNRINVISIATFLEKWRVAVLVIFVISMFLTPADPISMLLMATPLTVLYFLGIVLCKWMPKSRSPFDETYEP